VADSFIEAVRLLGDNRYPLLGAHYP